jgi:hypothetical protein
MASMKSFMPYFVNAANSYLCHLPLHRPVFVAETGENDFPILLVGSVGRSSFVTSAQLETVSEVGAFLSRLRESPEERFRRAV